MACEDEDEFTLDHESHAVFTPEHDRQLLAWLHRRPEDWDDRDTKRESSICHFNTSWLDRIILAVSHKQERSTRLCIISFYFAI